MVEAGREGGGLLYQCHGDLFLIITGGNFFCSFSQQTGSVVTKTRGEAILTTKKVKTLPFLNKHYGQSENNDHVPLAVYHLHVATLDYPYQHLGRRGWKL